MLNEVYSGRMYLYKSQVTIKGSSSKDLLKLLSVNRPEARKRTRVQDPKSSLTLHQVHTCDHTQTGKASATGENGVDNSLRYILSDINMATPACLLRYLWLEYPFPFFYSELMFILKVRCVFFIQ